MSSVESCPLCHRNTDLSRKNLLYGHVVCKKCRNGFSNRRQIAFVIDSVLIQIFDMVALLLLLPILMVMVADPDGRNLLVSLASYGLVISAFLAKDAFGGRSPGKA